MVLASGLPVCTAGGEFKGESLQAAFGVTSTPFAQGIRETLTDPCCSDVALSETA